MWLVDPLDGTNNFAHGKPCFAVIVALCQDGVTRAGWIHDPLGGLTAWSVAGEGAWIREAGAVRRLSAAAPAPMAKMEGSLGDSLRKRLTARGKTGDEETPARMVRYRCVGQEYLDLARGRLHFARYGVRLKPWDHAAGVLLHREAGGFGALVEGPAPYSPRPGIVKGTLLLAARRERLGRPSHGVERRLVSCPNRMFPSVWDEQATTHMGIVYRFQRMIPEKGFIRWNRYTRMRRRSDGHMQHTGEHKE